MKKILILFLILFSSIAKADWTKVQVTDHGKLGSSTDFIDLDSMMKLPNDNFQVWVLYSYNKSYEVYLDNNKTKQAKSQMTLVKYDCKNQTAIPISGKTYSGEMAKGDLVSADDFSTYKPKDSMTRIEPNTLHMAIWKKYCK